MGYIWSLGHTFSRGSFESSVAAVWGAIAGYIGQQETVLRSLAALALLVACDWISGIKASAYEGKPIESSKLRRTGDKIVGYSIGALVLALLAKEMGLKSEWGAGAVTSLCWWYMATEAWSIAENLDRMGTGMPKWVKKRLRQAKDTFDMGGDLPPQGDKEKHE